MQFQDSRLYDDLDDLFGLGATFISRLPRRKRQALAILKLAYDELRTDPYCQVAWEDVGDIARRWAFSKDATLNFALMGALRGEDRDDDRDGAE